MSYLRAHAGSLRLFGSLVLLASAIGCSGDGRLDVAPVRGRVVYRGAGVPRAGVIFVPGEDMPEKGKKLRPFADTDAQGNFALKTYIGGDGAPPGKYRVCIIVASAPASGSSKDRRPGEEQVPASAVVVPQSVTAKYRNADTSGIEVTVKEGENDLEPFVLL